MMAARLATRKIALPQRHSLPLGQLRQGVDRAMGEPGVSGVTHDDGLRFSYFSECPYASRRIVQTPVTRSGYALSDRRESCVLVTAYRVSEAALALDEDVGNLR